jgi:hypothetical protein
MLLSRRPGSAAAAAASRFARRNLPGGNGLLSRCLAGAAASVSPTHPKAKYDVAIVGGGHNALVCANYLARSGLSCVVLESRELVGGAAVTEELFPGFKYSRAR